MKLKSLREVPLKNYQRLQKYKNPDNLKILTVLFGYKKEDILKAKQKEIDNLVLHVQNELEKENALTNIIEIDKIEYGFIPNLDEITYGENADITKYLNDWQTMHKAMAVLYRPVQQTVGDRYRIEKYEGTGERAEIMKHMPLDVVLSAIVFFYNLTKELLKCTPSYLQQKITQEKISKQVLAQSGEDMQSFILLHREILEDLMKSAVWDYSNV